MLFAVKRMAKVLGDCNLEEKKHIHCKHKAFYNKTGQGQCRGRTRKGNVNDDYIEKSSVTSL